MNRSAFLAVCALTLPLLGAAPAVPVLTPDRVHFDVVVPHDVAEQRMQAALDAGGVLGSDARARAYWVLADSEGNEACICTWQDRS